MKLRIAVVVHGRFHAFDLSRELIRRGHDLILLTNYPKSIAAKFGIPPDRVRSALWHGVLQRLNEVARRVLHIGLPESVMDRLFSRWSLRQIRKNPKPDVVHCFSGVAEELFLGLEDSAILKTLVRGSSHIRTQLELLEQEEARVRDFIGRTVSIDKPSEWIVAREEREYVLADLVVVLSTFARRSFEAWSPQPKKICVNHLGSQNALFRPKPEVTVRRCERILGGSPLSVLTVGTFSLRKGALDLVIIAQALRQTCNFRFVGSIGSDAKYLRVNAEGLIDFVGHRPQQMLPAYYWEAL